MVKVAQSFFSSGELLKKFDHCSISLVPKVQNASTMGDYCPISCFNVVYKCIPKVLARRIKATLPNLIDSSQVSFILGKRICDNILLAQKLMMNYHRGNTFPRNAIKIDLLKAFDIVRWDYILDLLSLMDFPNRFVCWIKEYITTPCFSVNVNGELVGFLSSCRRLRQGGPLSSYLFVIAMDGLSMLISKRINDTPCFKFH